MDLYVPPYGPPSTFMSTYGSSSSHDHPTSPTSTKKASQVSLPKPPTFASRHGRRFHGDESIPYYLPCDVQELSRQSLFHEVQREVYGGLYCAEFSDNNIPCKVLELCCGTAIWSASVADEFAARGRPDVQFVGLDIVPVHADMKGVNFTFVKHNFQVLPLPFADGEFDYVFGREISMATPISDAKQMTECVRILKPGGTLEIQCSDYSIRSLQRSHITSYTPGSSAYTMVPTTQFASTAENAYIHAWNERITKMLTKNNLSPVPCTLIGPQLLMEEEIVGLQSKRVALPLDEIWWESPNSDSKAPHLTREKRISADAASIESRSGINRKSSQSTTRRSSTSSGSLQSPLTASEKAVRNLAKLTFAQLIESLEPVLRETNGIRQDDWDNWYKELMVDFFENGGLTGGECMEFGAWWGVKSKSS